MNFEKLFTFLRQYYQLKNFPASAPQPPPRPASGAPSKPIPLTPLSIISRYATEILFAKQTMNLHDCSITLIESIFVRFYGEPLDCSDASINTIQQLQQGFRFLISIHCRRYKYRYDTDRMEKWTQWVMTKNSSEINGIESQTNHNRLMINMNE